MGDHTAFFYGTLMAPAVLHRVIYGSSTPEKWQADLTTVVPALLQGYRRHRVKHADYPAVLPAEGAVVRGSLVTGLTSGDLWRLDIFEGDQYIRDKVRVKVLPNIALDAVAQEDNLTSSTAEEVEAETYVWIAPASELEEKEWDFEVFKREKMWAWTGTNHENADSGFSDVDRAVADLRNDPTGGRGANGGKITAELERARGGKSD